MRRTIALAISLVLIAGACGSSSKKDAAPSPTTTTTRGRTTSTTEALGDVRLTAECRGIGPAPKEWELTWVEKSDLRAVDADGTSRECLVAGVDARSLAWSGDGTRVLAASQHYVLEDGVHRVGENNERLLGWSRPAGRALLGRSAQGDVVKEVLDDDTRITLPFMIGTREVQYHPAGTAIVGVTDLGDRPNILMMSNLGTGERWLVDNESAHELHDLAFDRAGALLFVADHDEGHHLHRLDLATNELTTLFEKPPDVDVGPVVASQFDVGGIAAGLGGCQPTWVQIGGKDVEITTAAAARGTPLGWLPDGRLVVRNPDDRCGDAPGDLYIVDGSGVATRVAHGVAAAAIRAAVPPPPPAPPHIDEAAPS